MTDRVRQILSWYRSESPGVQANLYRFLMSGRLAGTGKIVMLPVDQGFEHGPARSFSPNPAGFDPRYHFQLAIDAGCNAYAAPLGFIEAGAAEYAGQIPLILKANNHDLLYTDPEAPLPAVTASVDDALRLGCSAIGFTIYPGSARAPRCTRSCASWPPRPSRSAWPSSSGRTRAAASCTKEAETAVDVSAYAAQIAAQLGAHIIKVKPPTNAPWDAEVGRGLREGRHQGRDADRPGEGRHPGRLRRPPHRHLLGRRGQGHRRRARRRTASAPPAAAFGTIMGRNSFQRPHDEAVRLLQDVMEIHRAGAAPGAVRDEAREPRRPERRTTQSLAARRRLATAPAGRRARPGAARPPCRRRSSRSAMCHLASSGLGSA